MLRLPPSRQLLFVKGSAPLLVEKINYLTAPEFRTADGDPLFKPNQMNA